jgi:hypothetical protein
MEHDIMGSTEPQNKDFFNGGNNFIVSKGHKGTH